MIKLFLGILALCPCLSAVFVDPIADLVWPLPAKYAFTSEQVQIQQSIPLMISDPGPGTMRKKPHRRVLRAYQRLNDFVHSECIPRPMWTQNGGKLLNLDLSLGGQGSREAYNLTIMHSGISLWSPNVNGLIHGLMTLRQLIQKDTDGHCWLSVVSIQDKPRFEYRGFLLDTSRNYFPKHDILRMLDGMAYAKLNVFHWHILDSQSFPILWDFDNFTLPMNGAYRYDNGSMKVYTKQDVQDILRYAADRAITVVPEFESPGHATVWGNAYPGMVSCANHTNWDGDVNGTMVHDWNERICAQPPCGQMNVQNAETYMLFGAFLKDMNSWFPSTPYWHLGFDEVNGKCWGVNDSRPLVALFFNRLQQILKPLKKRQKMYWDEILTEYHLQPDRRDTIIQAWHPGAEVTATSQGYRTVVSSYDHLYLDCGAQATWCAPYKNWTTFYQFDPTLKLTEDQASLVLGATACLWTETIKRDVLDRAAWPRLLALAESLWSPKVRNTSNSMNNTTNSLLNTTHPMDMTQVHRRLEYHRKILRTQLKIDAAELNFNGTFSRLYRPEWCDVNMGSPAAHGNDGYFPGNITHDYCAPAQFYTTNKIDRSVPG